jgi:hypothetical protein
MLAIEEASLEEKEQGIQAFEHCINRTKTKIADLEQCLEEHKQVLNMGTENSDKLKISIEVEKERVKKLKGLIAYHKGGFIEGIGQPG